LLVAGVSLLGAPPRVLAAEGTPARASATTLLRDPKKLASWLDSHSLELQAARARLAQSDADVKSSRLFQNPVLDASLANVPLGETNPPGLGFNAVAIYGVGLSQTIELGKRGPRGAGADLRQRSAALQVDSTQQTQLSAARYALGHALYRALRVTTLQESLGDAEGAADLEKTRYEQKALSGTEYDRLLLELANLKSDFERERATYAAALADCAALLGAQCDVGTGKEDDLSAAVPLDVSRAAGARLDSRADVKALDAESQAAQRDAQLARARAIPDVTVRLGYTHDRFVVSGDNQNTLSFGVTLPLPVFDRGQHDAARAESRALELRDMRAALLRDARADLFGLSTRKATLEKVTTALESESLPRSASVLASTQIAFDHGGVSLTDLLLARRNHIALQLTLLDDRFELFAIRNELVRVLALQARGDE
jgi:cobalt-zinc-cadmium efflux system outer membrane protein